MAKPVASDQGAKNSRQRLYASSMGSLCVFVVVSAIAVLGIWASWHRGMRMGAGAMSLFLLAFLGATSRLYLCIDVADDATLAFTGFGRCSYVPLREINSVIQGGLEAPLTLCLATARGRRFHLPIALSRSRIELLLDVLKREVPGLNVYVTTII